MAAYGVDVLDPGVSLRRIWVLANRLPPWARLPGEDWSAETHMLATLVDHVANLTWVTVQAAGGTGAQRPRPIPRPSPAVHAQAAPGPSRATAEQAPTWAAAIEQIAGMPGVQVNHG